MHKKETPLYRKVNTTAHGVHHRHGGAYAEKRHAKSQDDWSITRQSMHSKYQRGLDYRPLFKFLLSKIGEDFDTVYSEAIRRLDRPEPIFWMVARHEKDRAPYFVFGESSYYSGLFVDETGRLQKVDPSIGPHSLAPLCKCCTYTFNGLPFTQTFTEGAPHPCAMPDTRFVPHLKTTAPHKELPPRSDLSHYPPRARYARADFLWWIHTEMITRSGTPLMPPNRFSHQLWVLSGQLKLKTAAGLHLHLNPFDHHTLDASDPHEATGSAFVFLLALAPQVSAEIQLLSLLPNKARTPPLSKAPSGHDTHLHAFYLVSGEATLTNQRHKIRMKPHDFWQYTENSETDAPIEILANEAAQLLYLSLHWANEAG